MKKLTSKDLINTGIFGALFLTITLFVFCIAFTPIIQFARVPLSALLCGPVFLLLIAKTKKPVVIILVGLLSSAVVGFLLYGNIICFLINMAFFIIADLIAFVGKYESIKLNSIAYIIVSFWTMGEYGAFWFARDFMYDNLVATGSNLDYINGTFELMNTTALVFVLTATLVCAILSVVLAKILFKKHFKKAGII